MILNPNCSEWVTFLRIEYDDLSKKEIEELNKYLSQFDDMDCYDKYATIRLDDWNDDIEELIKSTPYADKLKYNKEQEYI